ncbi:hypothetical protein IRJ41_004890 [Triplophysa rosa]|uniref:Uncharacterized protein n=1 Tax=Triplophysa rosa TaxID=992332 RepID=A0A9W8C179_TRIRA|nr:hypothetical protein IRJ41_004890 [Triplophysa rosa]
MNLALRSQGRSWRPTGGLVRKKRFDRLNPISDVQCSHLSILGSASVGTDSPALTTWLKDELQMERVMRVFPLTDMLGSSPAVVGNGLVKVLLGDLYKRNERLPVAMLKGCDVPFGKLVGFRSIEEFAKELVKTKGFGYPNTFTRAVEMVVYAGVDFHCSLELGLSGFRYFQKIKYWDASRHAKASCNLGEYIELVEPKKVPSIEARAAAINIDVWPQSNKRSFALASSWTSTGVWCCPGRKRA